MITENGIVTAADTHTAWIKTIRSGACESCSSRESCGTPHGQKELVVSVDNTLNVGIGDQVVIGLETKPMLYLTFLLYVFPILMMIVGALIGDSTAVFFDISASTGAMIGGFIFFGLSYFFLRIKNKTLSKSRDYKPFLIRKQALGIQKGCTLP